MELIFVCVMLSFTLLYLIFNHINNKFNLKQYGFFCETCFAFAFTWNVCYWFLNIPTALLCFFIGLSFTGSWYQFCYFFIRDAYFTVKLFGKELNITYFTSGTLLWFNFGILTIAMIYSGVWIQKLIIGLFDALMFIILIMSLYLKDDFNKYRDFCDNEEYKRICEGLPLKKIVKNIKSDINQFIKKVI